MSVRAADVYTCKLEKTILLPPGKYSFQCKCGGEYRVMTLSEKTRVSTWCWYCNDYCGKHVKITDVMEENLSFTANWNNKLNCNAFTTLRLREDRKYHVGARVNVWLNNTFKGKGTIVAVSCFTIDKINESIARVDTGCSAEECRNIIQKIYNFNPRIDWKTQEMSFSVIAYDKKENSESGDLFGTEQ
jgi:uncharacterized protein YqfB (UPF0267 family)